MHHRNGLFVEASMLVVSTYCCTLSEDDGGISGLEAALIEPVQAVPHPHGPPNAAVDLFLFVVANTAIVSSKCGSEYHEDTGLFIGAKMAVSPSKERDVGASITSLAVS